MSTSTALTVPTQFALANGIRFAYRRCEKQGGIPLVFNQHFTGTMDAPHAHFSGELVAAPGHGPDEIAVGSQGLAQCRDLGLKAVLLDHPAGPHAAHQLVLGQDRPGGIDERQEHIESAAAERDGLAVCQQLAAMTNEREAAELADGSAAG